MTGQCFCGSVAFEFDLPITDIEICHCSRCQRATGSPFATEFRVRADKFERSLALHTGVSDTGWGELRFPSTLA